MNKGMNKMVAKTVVEVAAKTTKLPNQACGFFFGKPKTQMNLAVNDYENLEQFIKQNS